MGVDARLIPLHDQRAGNMRRALLVLSGVAGLLLLMVCSNVASLLLSRATVRARELAIRTALGASRTRVLRQLLAESLLLALLGGVFGFALASLGVSLLRSCAPAEENLAEVRLDATVCLFNLGVSLLAGVVFGLFPAFQCSRGQLVEVLKEGARESSSGRSLRSRGFLVVAQTALGVIVLIGAGLLLRSFVRLQQIPLGFNSENVLTLRVILRGPRYSDLAERNRFYQHAFQRIGELPGVRSVAAISFLPLTLQGRTTGISLEGQPPPAPGQLPFADFRSVSPEYFATMGVPLLRGRDFSWSDGPQSAPAAIVSETMARTFWPDGDAIGQRIKLGAQDENIAWVTIVGIAADVHQLQLIGQPRAAMYLSGMQDAGAGDTLHDWVLRVSGDPTAVASSVRAAVWAIDANLPISRVQTMEHVRSNYLGPQQFTLSLVALLAVLGLILAAVGLYGVAAYSVEQRKREIGVRMALGAQPSDVLGLIVGQGARLALLGLSIGIVAALTLTRLMASLLYGIGVHDPLTFVGVAVLLLAVALAACYIPARRATRVDPVVALRYE